MKDYSFGNFLNELRKRRGLSQYQLGMLVGVSDKAVSKWENGTSKPQSSILFKLSEVLGVSVDELLACKYRSEDIEKTKGVFAMKKEIYKQVHQRLHNQYGETPPIEVINRYLSEIQELDGTDMIIWFDFLGKLREYAKSFGEHIRLGGGIGSSFAAYVCGATEINPLMPHYYCPKCKKVEFDRSVDDGWDLAEYKCVCGEKMLHDGHNIPFETYRHVFVKNASFDIAVSPDFIEQAKEFAKKHFKDCKLIKIKRDMKKEMYSFVVMPKSESIADDVVLTIHEYYDRFCDYPLFNICVNGDMKRLKQIESLTNVSCEHVDFCEPAIVDEFKKGNTDGIPEFRIDFFKDMISQAQPNSFRDLIQLSGLSHGTGVWTDNAQELIESGIEVGKVIAYRDDVFNYIQEKLTQRGISNTGYACKITEDTRRGVYARKGVSDELRKQLADIGMDEWFADSIAKIKYLFPKAHGVLYVKYAAMLMWYKVHYPKEFEKCMK